jgi:uncharacterized membrane protein YgcG
VPKKAAAVFNSSVRDTLKRTITSAFKQGNFNQGLLDGIAYLAKVSAEHPSSVAVAPTQPRERLPAGGDQKGRGSFLMTALIVGGVVLLVLFVIRLLSGAGRPGMSGAGAPGGGGFLSSLFGAMGGVFLGNWLYNTFGGGHAHASDAGRSDAQSHDASDQYESTSGGWDGGETGGDSGGFDGGDFGGGDGGGGGGGDW